MTIGNFIEAKKHFVESIKIDSNNSSAHRALSRLTKYVTNYDEHFKELIKIYKKIDIDD